MMRDDEYLNYQVRGVFFLHSYSMSERSCYRNRRKRFDLRFTLIAGIYNFEL